METPRKENILKTIILTLKFAHECIIKGTFAPTK